MHTHTNTAIGTTHDMVANSMCSQIAIHPSTNHKQDCFVTESDDTSVGRKMGSRRDMKEVKQQRKIMDGMENSMMLHLHRGTFRKRIRGFCEVLRHTLPFLFMLLGHSN
jgi:hypothetical protein